VKKRIFSPWRIAALAALLAVVPGIVTCDHQSPESLLVLDVMAMSTQNQCSLRPGQAAQAIRPYGVLDLMITNQYWMYPRFRNMLQPINTLTGEGPTTPENEVHYLSVQRAKTYVDMGEFVPGSKDTNTVKNLGLKYMIDGVDSFVAAGVAPLTEGAVGVQVIPPELGNIFDTKMQELVNKQILNPAVWVTVYVSLYAQTQDRHVLRSNEFSFPIQLCWGCLVQPFCSTTVQDAPCYVGQDEPISASLCPFVVNHPKYCEPKCYPGQE